MQEMTPAGGPKKQGYPAEAFSVLIFSFRGAGVIIAEELSIRFRFSQMMLVFVHGQRSRTKFSESQSAFRQHLCPKGNG